MTEAEWLACKEPKQLLRFLQERASDRKLRLFACGCCRAVWHLITDGVRREAILIAEQHIDGEVTTARLGEAISAVHKVRRKRHKLDWAVYNAVRYPGGQNYSFADSVVDDIARAVAREAAPHPTPSAVSSLQGGHVVIVDVAPNADRLKFDDTYAAQQQAFSNLLRDIFGNPFRPIAFSPEWRTDTAITLARQMYEARDFGAMPILADALQDAGCDNEDILSHCRTETMHVRGCWVVDLVLGKE
jgi:hypothetical protein